MNMWVGDWEGDAEMKLAVCDEMIKGTGKSTAKWMCNDRLLVEIGEADMGGLGTMQMMGVWAYDTKAKKYRNWWFSEHGDVGVSTACYDEESKTWKMSGKGSGPCGNTISRGTAKFVDDNTVEWCFTERDVLGLKKMAEYRGTSKRK
ncbi:MAG: DUF1579 domain-containing protein [bacterium]|nr:DUF1579 domain-containing protein [bacterium]